MQRTCAVLYCHLCPVRLYQIFSHIIFQTARFSKGGKNYSTQNVCFDFLYNFCMKYFSFYEEFSEIFFYVLLTVHLNLLAPELFFLILAHSVYKM